MLLKKTSNKIYLILLIIVIMLFLLSFQTKDYRLKHCIESKCIDSKVFSNLPNYPKTFSKNLNDASENIYKQPEFYPTFETQGLNYYINPPQGYIGSYGFGFYPSEKNINAKSFDEINEITYIHTGWYVVNYQGLKLYPVLDDSIKNYFEIKIEPDTILLEPTWPFFEYSWAQKIKINIKVKNVPKGKYLIGIDVTNPDEELENKWDNDYKGRYVSAGMFSIGKYFYELTLNIGNT